MPQVSDAVPYQQQLDALCKTLLDADEAARPAIRVAIVALVTAETHQLAAPRTPRPPSGGRRGGSAS